MSAVHVLLLAPILMFVSLYVMIISFEYSCIGGGPEFAESALHKKCVKKKGEETSSEELGDSVTRRVPLGT
jgi:hypothetical protein